MNSSTVSWVDQANDSYAAQINETSEEFGGSWGIHPAVLVGMVASGGLGFTGNSLVVIVIFSSTKMYHKVTNIFIINQSLIDLAASIMLLFFALITAGVRMRAGQLVGASAQLYCRLFESETFIFGLYFSSTLNLVVLAVDRYMAIVHPFTHKSKVNPARVICACVLTWLLGICYNLSIDVPTTDMFGSECWFSAFWPNQSTRSVVGVLTFILQFSLPLGIMIGSYGKIALTLRQQVAPLDGKESEMTIRAKRNTLRTLIVVTLFYFLCGSWNAFFFLFFNLDLPFATIVHLYGPFGLFTSVMMNLNCCVNPFIYAANYRDFQIGFKKLFCKQRTETSGADESAVTRITH